ncbi:MAG: DUF1028 domain-containing protein [Proteobacteria bacterium]|nr:DUF1028 domain-containing protein [Pseudomonadota bacterium]
MTWSIVARDPETEFFGIAVATRLFAVGALCPWTEAKVDTKAFINPALRIVGNGRPWGRSARKMPDGISDRQHLRAEQIFFEELEQGIRTANREIIGARIPDLNKDTIHAMAVMVGRLRASYLEMAFKMSAAGSGTEPDASFVEGLRTRRQMFEEARDAYEALRRAVERGYIEIPGIAD